MIGPIFGRSLVATTGRWPKRSTKLPAMEERRLLLAPGEGSGGEFRSEEDIARVGEFGGWFGGGLRFLEGWLDSGAACSQNRAKQRE